MKRAIGILFLLLANISILVHAVVPHHHHSDEAIAIAFSGGGHTHTHTHDSESLCEPFHHHHDTCHPDVCPVVETPAVRYEEESSRTEIHPEVSDLPDMSAVFITLSALCQDSGESAPPGCTPYVEHIQPPELCGCSVLRAPPVA